MNRGSKTINEARENIQLEGLENEEARVILRKARSQVFEEHYGETPEFIFDVFGYRVGPFCFNGVVPKQFLADVQPCQMEKDAYWAITGREFVLSPINDK